MRRKEVTRRKTSISEVRASVHAHRGRIGRQLGERPAAPGEAAYSQAYFDHMDAELARVESGLIEAEDEHVRKRIQVSRARQVSEDLASVVYDKQTSARQILAGLYGSKHEFELGAMSGKTPQGPTTLPEQVDQTVKLLRNPEGETPAKKVGGVDVDFTGLADDLEGGLEHYRSSRVEFERRRKEADATRLESNQAIAEYDRVFPWVASSLEGLFRLVGERDLADRIRTSVRRVIRRQGEDGEPKPEEPNAGDSAAGQPPAESSEPAEASPSPAGS